MFGQWMGDNKIIIKQSEENKCPMCGRKLGGKNV